MKDGKTKKRSSPAVRGGRADSTRSQVSSHQAALALLDALPDDGLRRWLRRAIWVGTTTPIHVPPTSSLASYLGDYLSRGSTGLIVRLRDIMPILVQEWSARNQDAAEVLDRLLILCGALRCAAAEPAIALIARSRLDGLPQAVELRQRCLAVLAGFGCTERMVPTFKAFIQDADYTAFCYRALYRYDRAYAASELPHVMAALHSENKALISVLQFLFFSDELRPPEAQDVVLRMLVEVPKSLRRRVIELLDDVGVRIEPPSRGVRDWWALGLYPPKELYPPKKLGAASLKRPLLDLPDDIVNDIVDAGTRNPIPSTEREFLGSKQTNGATPIRQDI